MTAGACDDDAAGRVRATALRALWKAGAFAGRRPRAGIDEAQGEAGDGALTLTGATGAGRDTCDGCGVCELPAGAWPAAEEEEEVLGGVVDAVTGEALTVSPPVLGVATVTCASDPEWVPVLTDTPVEAGRDVALVPVDTVVPVELPVPTLVPVDTVVPVELPVPTLVPVDTEVPVEP